MVLSNNQFILKKLIMKQEHVALLGFGLIGISILLYNIILGILGVVLCIISTKKQK